MSNTRNIIFLIKNSNKIKLVANNWLIQRLYKFESNENLLNNFGNRKSLRMLGAETIRNNCGLIHHQVFIRRINFTD